MTITSVNVEGKRRAILRQKVAKTARWLHIYLSMVSFGIVLFFAITGLTVNHPDWFAKSVKTRQSHGTVDPALLGTATTDKPDTGGLIARMRALEHIHGSVAAEDIRVQDDEIDFGYKAPGYSADVTVDRRKGTYEVTEVRNGFVAVLNDLHKGRDAGKAWGWVIDFSAVFLTLVSLTGLVILWFIYKRRASGLLIGVVGLAVCALMWKIFVP